jgi:flagellar M-ring protein FliF
MKIDVAGLFEQIVRSYVKLPTAQKIALPLLFAATAGVVIFVSQWATRPQYRVLFSNLETLDASGIKERLEEQKIEYRFRNDGKVIEVSPPDAVEKLRIELAGLGLPKGGNVGFELWNETKLGQTPVGEAVNLTRALQGELERTIQAIEAVRTVRVHITNPKHSGFARQSPLPTASVLIKLKAGAELTKPQVKGIANLVSGSVERLVPDNVTILDQNGNMLNEKKSEEETGGADVTRLEYQRSVEAVYQKRVETMLTEVLGPGRVVARVTAEMDFNKFEKEEEAYDPAGIVTRSERASQESAGLTAEGGVPGVISNLTNDPGVLTPPDSSKNANVKRESVKNFEISRAVSRLVGAPGKLVKLSVAVLVDGQHIDRAAAAGADAAAVKKQYKPLSPEMMRQIENLVKQAVGYDSTRGDVISVENMPFMEADQSIEEVLKQSEKAEWWIRVVSWIVPIFLALLFILFVVRPLVSFLVTPTEAEIDLSRLLPAGIEELEAELDAERSKIAVMPERSMPSVDIEELETLLSENSRMVKENPQQAALLIRYWLNDGRM